ncbi:hypothetical protein AGR7A_Lc110096 [Agrobacterium deltaense NCPPB 1641]|uniref:Uncharacterized protein n=1 Tax=Agrobacterium deltaense NCPPB 1641 TaxID=1183425 RepID=A0A1S7TUD7_9HYPH|nr:hypothetical protein AGR7A_Lc110096 [Agrobacterium deltaense NCPPB 1641]
MLCRLYFGCRVVSFFEAEAVISGFRATAMLWTDGHGSRDDSATPFKKSDIESDGSFPSSTIHPVP